MFTLCANMMPSVCAFQTSWTGSWCGSVTAASCQVCCPVICRLLPVRNTARLPFSICSCPVFGQALYLHPQQGVYTSVWTSLVSEIQNFTTWDGCRQGIYFLNHVLGGTWQHVRSSQQSSGASGLTIPQHTRLCITQVEVQMSEMISWDHVTYTGLPATLCTQPQEASLSHWESVGDTETSDKPMGEPMHSINNVSPQVYQVLFPIRQMTEKFSTDKL